MIDKTCENCKHSDLDLFEVPCISCLDGGSLPKWEQVEQDNVNHPKHYEGSTSLECIEVMELAFGKMAVCDFCICNAFKYLWRYKNKNGVEDLNKAHWYIRKAEKLAEYDIDKERIEKLLEVYNKHTAG